MRNLHTTPHDAHSGLIVDGRYRLTEEIGRGSSGRVYRAVQLRVNREVAVKLLRTDLNLDERMSARFEREARAIATMDHPNCLTLHDFGYDEAIGSLFMVTELLDGATLARVVDDLPEMARLHVGYFIAEALMHAHQVGVVHRDLKPENVMVSLGPDGRVRVKVVDFGLAYLLDRGDTSGERRRLTLSGEIHGSPKYLSPEQCRGTLELTAATDMYAFGIILYEMFEGVVPFPGPSVPAVLTAHVSDEPPPMQSPPIIDIEQLVFELLAKAPEDRPSAHEARDVFARNVDLSNSGVYDSPLNVGLAEHTLDSDAFDEAPPKPGESAARPADPPAGIEAPIPQPLDVSAEIEVLLGSREARIGAVVGAVATLILLLLVGAVWMLTG